jgi:hypothetical protein
LWADPNCTIPIIQATGGGCSPAYVTVPVGGTCEDVDDANPLAPPAIHVVVDVYEVTGTSATGYLSDSGLCTSVSIFGLQYTVAPTSLGTFAPAAVVTDP